MHDNLLIQIILQGSPLDLIIVLKQTLCIAAVEYRLLMPRIGRMRLYFLMIHPLLIRFLLMLQHLWIVTHDFTCLCNHPNHVLALNVLQHRCAILLVVVHLTCIE